MVLTVLVLVPTAVLFGRIWTDNNDRRDSTELEKQGVQYITALNPLLNALIESESSRLQGVTEPPQTLAAAVNRVAAVDAEVGDELKTKERWADLQAKIGKLPAAKTPTDVLNTHIEVTDLTLALYAAIRRDAQLNRDSDGDIANMQQAVAVDMPTTVVRVNRAGDYATILPGLPAGAVKSQVQAQAAHEQLAVRDSVQQLTENLQAAVDNTRSGTLSGSLVSSLDSFRRTVEDMTKGATAGNAATVTTAQTQMQASLGNLSGITLREMDSLLSDRMDSLNYRRFEALAMAGLALLLVLAAVLWPVLSRRREPAHVAGPPVGESTRDVALDRPGPGSGPGPYGNPGPYDQAPGYGDLDPTRRERSGALR
ncbi:hypothetical protein [Actinoplanes sp. URMC 104]|uniref:hypothetical protein n=1 Tax=Actinoplanes sp. URMC 104 TaxID=3423409 RepID=UPI003F1BE63D